MRKKHFILLTGPDDFRIHRRKRFFINAFQKKYPEGNLMHLQSPNFEAVWQPLQMPNLFATKTLLIVEDFWNASHLEQAQKVSFFSQLQQQSHTTLISIEPKLDKRTKVFKTLQKEATMETYDFLPTSQLWEWCITEAKKHGSLLSLEDAKYLVDRCGENLWHLSQEIKKLALYCQAKPITKKEIDALTLPHPKTLIWDFLQHLTKKQASKALEALKNLLHNGESPFMIFSMIQREIRIHALLYEALQQNLPPADIAAKTRLHPFVVQKTLPFVKKHTKKNLQDIYQQLYLLDKRIKTGELHISTDNPQELLLALERFVIAFSHAAD